MDQRAELQRVGRDVFGWDRLRPAQLDAMLAVLKGRDVLAVMATGSGKSAIYQVPGVLLAGVTVVISPLIALQRDQISGLAGTDAPDAVAINSQLDREETEQAWAAVHDRSAEYVFLAPEQLANDDVLTGLAEAEISMVVVDEAHCVSAWGHDFRPDYLRIADAIERLGRPRVVALTATASPVVRREIVDQLRLADPVVLASGFDRPNIRLEASHHVTDDDKRSAVLAAATESDLPALLYTATRKDAETYAAELDSRGISALAYHAGLSRADRDAVHESFRAGEVDIVAATSAFGMGIDKADVRTVLHASIPDSVDNYYQQIGRAGRDGQSARARLFYRPEDLGLARFFTSQRPDEPLLATVYAALQSSRKPLRLNDLGIDAPARRLTNALNILEEAGVVESGPNGFSVSGAAGLDEAVARAVEVVERKERIDRSRVDMMRGYAETRDCRRQFLLSYFGETLDERCGHCDCCDENDDNDDNDDNDTAATSSGSPESADWPVDAAVSHRDWGDGVVMGVEEDRITVLFDDYGYRTLSLDAVADSGILQRR